MQNTQSQSTKCQILNSHNLKKEVIDENILFLK
jgi:hypothetical protein